uniref:RRM domain-containing protein n=1 Tax=Amphora coffeiformis TaxID=265554 RepID=A0A7S3LAZ2_9STRA|mmetsp:Transcript_10113/g.19452  ORF Transcript_10113/g.19452 Transcript_10113/m.19452 type:complete len:218 (+) Transcript_10113:77-730(+)
MVNQPNQTLYIKNIDWKVKKSLLKRALYSLCTRHGKVLEVIVLRRDGLRGQAWVVFEDVQAATAAMQAEQGFNFFGKDLVMEYAKEKSDRIAKREGTYVPKAKRQKKAPVKEGDEEKKESSKPTEEDTDKQTEAAQTVPSAPPSKYLLAQNLPSEINEMILSMLFRQYTGYKEVRMPRPGLAFVEFEDEAHATLALKALNGFKLTENDKLDLIYGKQ